MELNIFKERVELICEVENKLMILIGYLIVVQWKLSFEIRKKLKCIIVVSLMYSYVLVVEEV